MKSPVASVPSTARPDEGKRVVGLGREPEYQRSLNGEVAVGALQVGEITITPLLSAANSATGLVT